MEANVKKIRILIFVSIGLLFLEILFLERMALVIYSGSSNLANLR